MTKVRLDKELVRRGLVETRSRAEDLIRRGFVMVNGTPATKAGALIAEDTPLKLLSKATFVSRAGEKLYSVIDDLHLNFNQKTVLDVGSSTGGFTQVALQAGAQRVIAVDVGTNQLHPTLHNDPRIELHEKTDIRKFHPHMLAKGRTLSISGSDIEVVVVDVSFISLREVLPHVAKLVTRQTDIVVMVKPQFEAGMGKLKHKGVIKNDRMRREILRNFEAWAQQYFIIEGKADSKVAGAKGNVERFYKLHLID